ncbi:LPD7 domain-containing protein [Massilia soli]|uniref:Large polyvalent protein-associated domain-containing protein n=1 Tax=Massilia soli TaxID=2792854 RepID=A0ABS7SMU0_9BURK|nr:LPD7 domain-containing protein [Massilia soli]MBZ2207140.1 hypothetical protein [Massilia soli]
MAQATPDQQRFLLDDRIVTQVRYALTYERAAEPGAAKDQRSAIATADLRFYRGRKEVAAFSGLTAPEVDTLVGQANRQKMEQGIGRGKRNQPEHGIAGKLEGADLISVQSHSTSVAAKARNKAAASTRGTDKAPVPTAMPATPDPVARADESAGYQLKHYDEFGPVVREHDDLNDAIAAFRLSELASMPALVRGQTSLMDRDPDSGQLRFHDDAVRAAFEQHAQQDSKTMSPSAAIDEPATPAATSAMSSADRERLSALVIRMQAALDQQQARSFTDTSNWVRQDAEALQEISAERRHLARMVMVTAARRHPDYRAALSRQHPDAALEVESDIHAAELDERLQSLKREPATATAGAQPRQTRQPGMEINSIARDDARVQQASPADKARARPTRGVGRQVDLDKLKHRLPPALAAVATNVPEPADKPTLRIPREIEEAYLRVGNKFHYPQKPTLQAFEDKGTRLETKSSSARIVSDLVKIASAREWDGIRVNGSDAFRQKVWLEATLQGIAVKGYRPSEVDLALLAQRDRRTLANSVERDAARAQAQAQTARGLAPDHHGKDTAHEDQVKARLAGTLLEHGKARFNFDQAEPLNYYVKLRDTAGKERTTWGVGLESAIKDSQARIGQHIELTNLGKQPVSVSANLRDDAGKVIGKQTRAAHRNQWEIKADSFRSEEPRQAMKAHPDLVGAYAILRAAQVVADQNFQSREDRERFMTLAKETLARQMAERQGVPAVRIREQASEVRQEHGKERTIGR